MFSRTTTGIVSVFFVASTWVGLAMAFNTNNQDNDEYETFVERIGIEDSTRRARLFTYESDCTGQKGTGGEFDIVTPNPMQNKPPVVPSPNPNPGIPSPVRPSPGVPYPRPGIGGNELDQIVNAGLRIWTFIRDNSPTVTARHSYAHALPKGIKCWDEMLGWSIPRSEIYRLTVMNKWTKKVDVLFDFRLVYQWGGNVNGVGNFIANASVEYDKLEAAWGIRSVDADVEVPLATNVSTVPGNPIAGMRLNVVWTVKASNHKQGSESFFIFGDGRPSEQLE